MKFLKTSLLFVQIILFSGTISAQNFTEILGRPTNKSVTISALFDQIVQVYFEYGTTPGSFSAQTATFTSLAQTPVVTDFQPLEPNTRYYYRTVYKTPGAANFQFGPTRTFHTQRAPGAAFTFTLEADEHLYDKKGIRSLYEICLDNQAKDGPDFMLSLGDTFGDDHTPETTTSADMKELHLDYRQYLGKLCHSAPFFFCLGNHEGESGYWLDQTPPNNIAVYGTNWRKFYYPNPYPNDFYSGNMTQEPWGIGYPENYYAFTWGDALFVILDVYRDCDVDEKPKNWDWTLGKTQYDWFKNALETSTAKHKFVFAHHNRGQGRGGVVPATGFEWGGMDNGQYKFDQFRPGWGDPIHQLMVKNGVNIFFQGHDHLYAWEKMDNLVYQEVPMPSDTSYEIGVLANADAYNGLTLDGSGHLRVRVESDCVTVDYVAAYLPEDTLGAHKNREIRHSYKVCDGMVSSENVAETAAVQALPNPFHDYIFLKNVDENALCQLSNSVGQVVFLGKNLSERNFSELPSGLYFLKILGDNTAALRLLKN